MQKQHSAKLDTPQGECPRPHPRQQGISCGNNKTKARAAREQGQEQRRTQLVYYGHELSSAQFALQCPQRKCIRR